MGWGQREYEPDAGHVGLREDRVLDQVDEELGGSPEESRPQDLGDGLQELRGDWGRGIATRVCPVLIPEFSVLMPMIWNQGTTRSITSLAVPRGWSSSESPSMRFTPNFPSS